ncbi:MAG TPA: hypothetical protein VK459_19440 [Polyangiaceae bacterium]|nr:hypothetical protein [Polyangiaceae bacterium]
MPPPETDAAAAPEDAAAPAEPPPSVPAPVPAPVFAPAPVSAPAPEPAPAPAPAPDPPPGPTPPQGGLLNAITRVFPRIDDTLFPVFAGACVLYAAVAFYRSMHVQTGGVWSAPLDDVFIHFDYARATARGYPFEWSEGNGFSSGNTSLLYPFVLALGYWAGFRGLVLMQWAALVACASTLAFFLCSARVCDPLGRWAKYLLPPVVLSVGALNWSLWSGMENALHLGVWGLALVASLAVVADPPDARAVRRRSLLAGLAGALLFVTRPESVVSIAAFAVFVALAIKTRFGGREALFALVLIGLPGALALGLQSGANRLLTGEWSSAGAITKLAINNPYMTPTDKWNEYIFHLKYVVLRLAQHHFSSALPWGWLVPAVALIGLAKKTTRPLAILLWVQVLGWLALVSMNGQVRWQNERYTMSAVAWLLVLAALGLATLMSGFPEASSPRPRLPWAARAATAAALSALFWHFQAPNVRDQIWFFGRASRNIRDQHVVAGQVLGGLSAKRVLVGDAGALIYASDRPGLDLIGLGGYHDFPFARAGVHGLGASIELIERMPEDERPDFMAIYPSWWGDLPSLFGKRLIAIPVVGNVICGGAEKVIYRARWGALDHTGTPRSIREDEVVIDELDVADLMSERAHEYVFPRPSMGFVGFHVLEDPALPSRDLFDAGRHIPHGQREVAKLRSPRGPGRLVVRTVAPDAGVVEVRAAGRVLGRLSAGKQRGWAEPSIDLPPDLPSLFELELTRVEGEWTSYHVWVLVDGDDGARRRAREPIPSRESGP